MPHQCLNCSKIYPDNSDVILKGCTNCGKKLFLYIRKDVYEKRQKNIQEEHILTKKEKTNIEKQVKSIIGYDNDKPIILTPENINVLKEGKYEIDINQLLKKDNPIIFKVQNGTYYIDLNFMKENE